MSVVCCKVTDEKIEIASDSITVRGWTQSKGKNSKFSKLTKVNGIILGGVGYAEETALFQLFCQTHKPKDATEDDILTFLSEFSDWKKKRADSHKIENPYIIVYKGKAFAIQGFLVEEIVSYEAIGAGSDFALSALYLGFDVEKAVETACELSIYCEKPVIKFEYIKGENKGG